MATFNLIRPLSEEMILLQIGHQLCNKQMNRFSLACPLLGRGCQLKKIGQIYHSLNFNHGNFQLRQ